MRLIDADELVAQMEADAEQMDEMIAKMFAYLTARIMYFEHRRDSVCEEIERTLKGE